MSRPAGEQLSQTVIQMLGLAEAAGVSRAEQIKRLGAIITWLAVESHDNEAEFNEALLQISHRIETEARLWWQHKQVWLADGL